MSATADDRSRMPSGRLRALLPSVLVNGVVPLVAYALLRPWVGTDAVALAIGTAVPVVTTILLFAVRRRLDPIGVLAVLAYGIALLVLLLSGGNALVLKLQEAVVTGPLGLACLASVAVGRPLHEVVLRVLARRNDRWREALRAPGFRRTSSALTLLVGALMTVHAAALLILALTLPTSAYLAVSRPIGWAIIAIGVAGLLFYRNRIRSSAVRQGADGS